MDREDEKKIIELRSRKRPMSYFDISLEIGVCQENVGKFCRKHGLNKNNHHGKKL